MIVDDPVELLEAGDDGGSHLGRGWPAGHPAQHHGLNLDFKTNKCLFPYSENAKCRENSSKLTTIC